MKKLIAYAMAILMLAFPLASLADGMDAANDLTSQWGTEGYPDDVGGVFYEQSGKCGVLLIEPSDTREAEIRALTGDPDSLFFVKCSYSYNDMCAVQQEIAAQYMGEGKPVHGCGVGWTSKDGSVCGFGESGYEMRVVAAVTEADYESAAALLSEAYGDMVFIEISEATVISVGEDMASAEPLTEKPGFDIRANSTLLIGILLAAAIIVLVILKLVSDKKKASVKED